MWQLPKSQIGADLTRTSKLILMDLKNDTGKKSLRVRKKGGIL